MPSDTPINLTIALQNHALVPLHYFSKLCYLEQLYKSGLLVWRGSEAPPADLPPQHSPGDPDDESGGGQDDQLAAAGPVTTIDPSAFLNPAAGGPVRDRHPDAPG